MHIINSGLTSGYIYNLKDKLYYYDKSITDTLKEVDLFNNALNKCYERLLVLLDKTTGTINDILKMHMAFIKDPVVKEEVINRIKELKESAGTAYSYVVDIHVENLKSTNDEYLKERANDLLDIKDKVLKEMYDEYVELEFDKDTILVVDNLKTSTVLSLSNNVKGIIARSGADLSHAAILTKEKNIVYVVVEDINYKDDTFIVIDTPNNIIKEEESSYINSKKTFKKEDLNDNIEFYLNVSDLNMLKEEYSDLYKGVGLVRSELLFTLDNVYPDFLKQVNYYKEVLSFFYPKRVNIRMFDIKKDKEFCIFGNYNIDEFLFDGPLSLIYKEQLKALLYANEAFDNLNIIIPMINNVGEYVKVKAYLEDLKEKHKLINYLPKLGIMLETKKSFENIDKFKEIEFISVGTNDLCEELYEVSRKNSKNCQKQLKNLINDVKIIADFANENNIPFTVCGDHASTEEGLKELLNKGIKSLSIADGFLSEAVNIINKTIK